MHISRLIVAGEESGCGKSTVAIGLMGALAGAGFTVQGFKAGPDFIDPSYYRAVTGRPGRNLDLWMLAADALLELFARSGGSADVAVIEGVMGLFDGAYPDGRGSTAHLAKVLQSPVLLVLDAWRSSSSLGAKALGFGTFDSEVRVAGVFLNGVAGEAHERAAREAVAQAGLPVVGAIPLVPEIRLPERHLGLIPFEEGQVPAARVRQIVDLIRTHCDLERIIEIARRAGHVPEPETRLFAPRADRPEVRLAVARDQAFTFYYEDNLDLLRHWGFTVVEFSPLDDSAPPPADLLYFGGGFPEVFADRLARNRSMKEAIREFHRAGGAVYGECGGFMYLGEVLTTVDGQSFPMVGLFPIRTLMAETLQALTYKEVEVLQAGGFFRPGDRLKGHEFHFSRLASGRGEALRSVDSTNRAGVEGSAHGNALASYTHLHLGSNPLLLHHLAPRHHGSARGAAGKH